MKWTRHFVGFKYVIHLDFNLGHSGWFTIGCTHTWYPKIWKLKRTHWWLLHVSRMIYTNVRHPSSSILHDCRTKMRHIYREANKWADALEKDTVAVFFFLVKRKLKESWRFLKIYISVFLFLNVFNFGYGFNADQLPWTCKRLISLF